MEQGMSDSKSLNDWMQDWEALQRQYMNAWSEVMAKAPTAGFAGVNPFATAPSGAGVFGAAPFGAASPFGATAFGGNPFVGAQGAGFGHQAGWHEGLEQWSRMFADAGKQSDTVERLQTSAKSYLAMIQSMFGAAQQAGMGATPVNPMQAWLESLRNTSAPPAGFGLPGIDAAALNNPFAKALRDMAGHGAKGFTEMPAAFAPFIEQLRQDGLSWLKLPAFGVGREHQEHYQKTALAFVEYSQALQNYNALMSKASQRGFELFEVKLAERGESLRSIESLRALYDLWVDAAEEAYAEIALSEEFAKVYGELANAQMRARAQVQAEVERISTDLGMPTRSELNSLHKRVHDLRREVRDDKETQVGTSELEAQIAALRDEVADLQRTLSVVDKARQPAQAKAPPATEASRAKRVRSKKAANNQAVKPVTKVAEPVAIQSKASPAHGSEAPAHAAKRPGGQRRVRVPATRQRIPAPVVRPRPMAADSGKTVSKATSFGDAIAAMRQKVTAKSGKTKSVGASVSKPSKHNARDDARRRPGKRKK
jgi:polyhydroxyalkanoate synthase subunit PhaE